MEFEPNTPETSTPAPDVDALLKSATAGIRSPGYGLEVDDLKQESALAILIAEKRMGSNMSLAYARVRGAGAAMDEIGRRFDQFKREAPEEELANHTVTPDTEREVHRSSVAKLLATLMAGLRPVDRQLLKAIYYDGKTYAQAGAELARNPEALNRRHRIVMDGLRRILEAKHLALAHLTW